MSEHKVTTAPKATFSPVSTMEQTPIQIEASTSEKDPQIKKEPTSQTLNEKTTHTACFEDNASYPASFPLASYPPPSSGKKKGHESYRKRLHHTSQNEPSHRSKKKLSHDAKNKLSHLSKKKLSHASKDDAVWMKALSFLTTAEGSVSISLVEKFLEKLHVFKFIDKKAKIFLLNYIKKNPTPEALSGILKKVLSKASSEYSGNVLALVATAVQIYKDLEKGDFAKAIGTIYATIVSMGVPWAGTINTLQSLLAQSDFLKEHPQQKQAFLKFLGLIKLFDPVKLGQQGIESILKFIGIVSKKNKIAELEKLVKQLEKNGLGTLTHLGEDLGDKLYELLDKVHKNQDVILRTSVKLGKYFSINSSMGPISNKLF